VTRLAHFGISVALTALSVLCGVIGVVLSFALAVSKDSVPGASIVDADFILLYVVCGGFILAGLWGAWNNLKRALQAPKKPATAVAPAPFAPAHTLASGATADERLAPLVKHSDS